MGPKRPTSLANFLKPLIIEAVRPALGETVDVERRIAEAVSALLRRPKVKLRVGRASPGERAQVGDDVGERLGVGGETRAADGGVRAGDRTRGIGEGQPDGLGPNVEAEEAVAWT